MNGYLITRFQKAYELLSREGMPLKERGKRNKTLCLSRRLPEANAVAQQNEVEVFIFM